MIKSTIETAAAPSSRLENGLPRLVPEDGVRVIDGQTHAVSLPFWLRFEPAEAITRRKWIRLRYASSFFDEPVRPLIRFVTAAGKTFIQAMNGPVLGSAEWIGRVPDGTVSVSISPGRRLGPFSFRLERLEPMWRLDLLRRGLMHDPPWFIWALRSRLIDSREEAWQALKYSIGGTPLARYGEWHARMARPLELDGFDRPRADWSATPGLHLLMRLQGDDAAALETTLASLRGQAYPRWSLHAAVGENSSAAMVAAYRSAMQTDRRLFELSQAPPEQAPAPDDRLAVLSPGDRLPDHALAAVAETLAREPDLAVLYGDEDAIGRDGQLHSPILKPDWSPAFHQATRYVGRLAYLRYADLAASGATPLEFLSNEAPVLDGVLARAERKRVGHVRRVLYRRLAEPQLAQNPAAPLPAVGDPAPAAGWPEVSVVIPTKDGADLLEACTRGLMETTDYPSLNVVIVDNGSTDPKALAMLAKLRADPRFHVLERPGPFNYAAMSNDGAAHTKAPMLLFLNNDIEMLEPGWLKAMVRWAVRPEIGVVGAKLLFPNRIIQHAGVVLGMGGIAGHVYRRSPENETGYLRQLETPREATAVTAACITVERSKFDAAGGFDAKNLPVDLNDMDLCLRVAERGWTNLCTPEAVLTHVQSASRGMERDPFDQYRKERGYFIGRWSEVIRDDAYFHPGLSLFTQQPELG
jgi:GT2 family glycosyltransferase